MLKVKYIRWSTINQTGSRQLLDAGKYDLVLQEQVSGTVLFANRQKGGELLNLIAKGKVTELYVEELSRLGRNAKDTLNTLEVCAEHGVNVHIQNMSISSIPNGKPNPVFKLITHMIAVISEQEAENIRERTEMGKLAARSRGQVFGRKVGTNERKIDFLKKDKSKAILKHLGGNQSIRNVAKLAETSPATVQKVKKIAEELKLLSGNSFTNSF
ncbi:MAG: recombinase family protein [Flavobacterium sp.]|nr:MAG: recombinase family protein [Flavobacterium sp.]